MSGLDSSGRPREVLSSGLRTQAICIKTVSKNDIRAASRPRYSAAQLCVSPTVDGTILIGKLKLTGSMGRGC